MRSPVALGYVVITYGVVLFLYPGGVEAMQVALYQFAAPIFAWLPIAFVSSYVAGGVALCLRRRWASLIVLLTTICHLLLYLFTFTMLYALDGSLWGAILLGTSVGKSLVAFLPPLLIAYFAWRLRREPDAWTRNEQTGEPIKSVQRLHRRQAFWGVVAIGTALIWLASFSPDRRISVAGMPLCYPVEYAINADYLDSLFASVRGSYVDVDWETMLIPDRLLTERVPGYAYDPRNSLVLYGAVFAKARLDPAEYAGHCVPATGISGFQDMCYFYFDYGIFGYRHAVQRHNRHLRGEIETAIYGMLEEWNQRCAR